jgi:type IV pilus assembly protein PilA
VPRLAQRQETQEASMLHRLRQRARDERGFTLIELLVVILIIGILAAIAIPSFLNQKSKAVDAAAKELAHSAQVAAETYGTDYAGSYAGLTASYLNQYEATIQITSGGGNAYVSNVAATSNTYTLTVKPASGSEVFTLTRNSNGQTVRTCSPTSGTNGGCVNGSW